MRQKIRNIFIYNIGKSIIFWLEKLIERYSSIGNDFFFDPNYFKWVSQLEENWQPIRKELNAVLEHTEQLPGFHDISQDQIRLSSDGLWKTFFLYGYGIKMEQNCQYCPLTTELIEKIPGMKTAFFSILLPGKHIAEHRGAYKGVLRYQLALKVPEDRENCLIRVGKEFRHWEAGKSLLFDDSFPHEAWNLTNEVRVVLFMDVVRPLRFPVNLLNRIAIDLIRRSPYVQDAHKNQQQWDKRLANLFEDKAKETNAIGH